MMLLGKILKIKGLQGLFKVILEYNLKKVNGLSEFF